jgi:hypothetical protein
MAASASPPPDHPLASPETRLDWVKHHPELQHLMVDQRSAAPQPLWRQFATRIRGLMVASPADFHGTADVSASTHKDSQLVASGVTAGNFSLFLFACGAGNPLGWVTASLLTGLLFKFDKGICTTVARGRKGNRKVALVAIQFGLVPLSLLKSFGTGLGVEVLQNRTQLEQLQASKIVNAVLDDQRRLLKRLETPDAGTAAVQVQCRTGHPFPVGLRRSSLDEPSSGALRRVEPAPHGLEPHHPQRAASRLRGAEATRGCPAPACGRRA